MHKLTILIPPYIHTGIEQFCKWMAGGRSQVSHYGCQDLQKTKRLEARIIHVVMDSSLIHLYKLIFRLICIQMAKYSNIDICVYVHFRSYIYLIALSSENPERMTIQ